VGPWPGGENLADVQARADRVIARILDRPAPGSGRGTSQVALVGHGHFSRVLAARWVGQEAWVGAWLDLGTATWSQLGWYREDRVLRHWNVPAQARP
jgi:probable phosphoglycerate mutase